MQNLKFVALTFSGIITGGTRKNWAVPGYAHARAFVRMDPLNVLANLKSVAFPIPEILGGTLSAQKNLGSPWICPRSLFYKIFHGLLFGWTLLLFWPNLKFVLYPFLR